MVNNSLYKTFFKMTNFQEYISGCQGLETAGYEGGINIYGDKSATQEV